MTKYYLRLASAGDVEAVRQWQALHQDYREEIESLVGSLKGFDTGPIQAEHALMALEDATLVDITND